MERLQYPPPSRSEDLVPSLPAVPPAVEVNAVSLLQRLQALRAPGVTQQELDAFMDGLSADPPAGESPRVRADVMLDILEDSSLCALTASDGSRVGSIALEVLMELGFPYALEVTPSMLKRARGPRPLHVPTGVKAGLALAGVNGLIFLAGVLQEFNQYLELHEVGERNLELRHPLFERNFDDAVMGMPVFLILLLGPAALSGLTWWLRLRGSRPVFNASQWLVGLGLVLLGLNEGLLGVRVTHHEGLMVFCGVATLLSAWLLRPRPEPSLESGLEPGASAPSEG